MTSLKSVLSFGKRAKTQEPANPSSPTSHPDKAQSDRDDVSQQPTVTQPLQHQSITTTSSTPIGEKVKKDFIADDNAPAVEIGISELFQLRLITVLENELKRLAKAKGVSESGTVIQLIPERLNGENKNRGVVVHREGHRTITLHEGPPRSNVLNALLGVKDSLYRSLKDVNDKHFEEGSAAREIDWEKEREAWAKAKDRKRRKKRENRHNARMEAKRKAGEDPGPEYSDRSIESLHWSSASDESSLD